MLLHSGFVSADWTWDRTPRCSSDQKEHHWGRSWVNRTIVNGLDVSSLPLHTEFSTTVCRLWGTLSRPEPYSTPVISSNGKAISNGRQSLVFWVLHTYVKSATLSGRRIIIWYNHSFTFTGLDILLICTYVRWATGCRKPNPTRRWRHSHHLSWTVNKDSNDIS